MAKLLETPPLGQHPQQSTWACCRDLPIICASQSCPQILWCLLKHFAGSCVSDVNEAADCLHTDCEGCSTTWPAECKQPLLAGFAGCLHPDYSGYFASPTDFMKWYTQHGPLKGDASMPTVAVLLYRKHVITEQPYIAQLVRCMEMEGVRPVPIFINGIEAHTVVSTPQAGESRSLREQFLSRVSF